MLLLCLPAARNLQAKEQKNTGTSPKSASKQSVQKTQQPESPAAITPQRGDVRNPSAPRTIKKAATKKPTVKKAAKPRSTKKVLSRKSKPKSTGVQAALLSGPTHGKAEDASSLQARMKKYLGVPYRRGGSSAAGMDCSGFSKFIYSRLYGVDLPHKAASQFALPCMRRVSTDQLQTGDLLFFSSRRGRGHINHVGIYLEDGKFIHSASGKGVTISALENRYWRNRLVGSKRMPGLGDSEADEFLEARGDVEFFLNERSSLRFQFASLIGAPEDYRYGSWGSWDPSLYGVTDHQINDPLFSMKLGYNRHVLNDRMNVRLSALWARASTDDLAGGFFSPSVSMLWPSLLGSSAFYRNAAYTSGLEIAGDIDLFQWLRVTPSATYLGYNEAEAQALSPRGILGLEASLGSPASSYAVSMALHYSRPEDALYFWSPSGSGRDSLDMSFAFRYHLTNIMQLSVVGQQSLYDNLLAAPGSLFGGDKGYSNLFFTLDYSY